MKAVIRVPRGELGIPGERKNPRAVHYRGHPIVASGGDRPSGKSRVSYRSGAKMRLPARKLNRLRKV